MFIAIVASAAAGATDPFRVAELNEGKIMI